ncbi:MAG TPA: ABC transporter substrate binding protein [Candidatus Dormibacteraeota bacterium]|nr:ABC transporter substrate binding protein [Candidatus Dormibacteraeota bacterium]
MPSPQREPQRRSRSSWQARAWIQCVSDSCRIWRSRAGTLRGSRSGIGAIVVLSDSYLLEPSRDRIIAQALRHRLLAIYWLRSYVDAGGLMSYGADLIEIHRRAGGFVDRILRGGKPSEMPVEEPTKFELVINLKTAKALGLTIPPSLLQRADQVIE